jgi:hypothetical protein
MNMWHDNWGIQRCEWNQGYWFTRSHKQKTPRLEWSLCTIENLGLGLFNVLAALSTNGG